MMATELTDATASLSLTSPPGPDDLSPLEQDVLEEYERLADNMKKASILLSTIRQPMLILHAARVPSRWISRRANRSNFRWAATVGTQDELGVYVTESERVQYCTTTGDLFWRSRCWAGLVNEASHGDALHYS